MSGIFISRASPDEPRAQAIAEALRARGLEVEAGEGTPALNAAPLVLVCWSQASVADPGVIDAADSAKARGVYLGVRLDNADLPFGFGGLQQVELDGWNGRSGDPRLAELAEAARARIESGSSGVMALPTLPSGPVEKSKLPMIVGGALLALLLVAGIAFLAMRARQPTMQDRIVQRFAGIPCAWLNIDPVQNGDDGTLMLTGVAGDPASAGRTVQDFAKSEKLPIEAVAVDKVAQIDPRECAAIEAPIKLRKAPGSRLKVTGEPFILVAKTRQALVRVGVALADTDNTVALFGIEPSGQVTWSIPDIETMRSLKQFDVGLVESGDKGWEFSIYPDHLGWTGLLLVVGDGPLAQRQPPGTVQTAGDFARTIAEATKSGRWDAEMVWFRIDQDPAR